MPNHHQSSRAAAALLLAALPAIAACGGRRAAPRQTPAPTAQGDSTPITGRDARTLENMFAGRFPGVTVAQSDGGGLQIRIRGGNNSIYGSSEPLYVVDGSPLPEGTGGIVFLNPYDIEKIEVLKNPADIGIYGIRGANGVIRITTVRPGRR